MNNCVFWFTNINIYYIFAFLHRLNLLMIEFCTGALIPLLISLRDRSLPCASLRCSQDAVQFFYFCAFFCKIDFEIIFAWLSRKLLESARARSGPHLASLRSGLHFHPQAHVLTIPFYPPSSFWAHFRSFFSWSPQSLHNRDFPGARKNRVFLSVFDFLEFF